MVLLDIIIVYFPEIPDKQHQLVRKFASLQHLEREF